MPSPAQVPLPSGTCETMVYWRGDGSWRASPVLREENRGEAITNSDVIVSRRVCAGHSADQLVIP